MYVFEEHAVHCQLGLRFRTHQEIVGAISPQGAARHGDIRGGTVRGRREVLQRNVVIIVAQEAVPDEDVARIEEVDTIRVAHPAYLLDILQQ